jgi:hypothetical protein
MKIGNLTEADFILHLDDDGIYNYASKARLAWHKKAGSVTVKNLHTNKERKFKASSCADALRQYLAENAY